MLKFIKTQLIILTLLTLQSDRDRSVNKVRIDSVLMNF